MAAEYDPQEQPQEVRAPLDRSAARVETVLPCLGEGAADSYGSHSPPPPPGLEKVQLSLDRFCSAAKVNTLRADAPSFVPMGPPGLSSTDDQAQTSIHPQAEDGEGGDAPPHSLQPSDTEIMLQLMTKTLGSSVDGSRQLIASPCVRLEYFLLAGGSLASLRSNLEGHRGRCEDARCGDKVKILDMERWPMTVQDGRILKSAESICKITRVRQKGKRGYEEFETVIQDLGPPFQCGKVQLHRFMFEYVRGD